MHVADLETSFDYSYWANRKLFAVISQLTPTEFAQSVAGSYGSIRNTLVHMLSAERGWLDRCGGPRRGPKLNPDDYPTPDSVISAWAPVETCMRAFLADLSDEDLDRSIEFAIDGVISKRSMPLGELLQHTATHCVHHRGQVALLLRAVGKVPGNFDILFYYAEKHVAPAL
jgi:uncharacterized damage-inducible protein DinB